MDTSLAFETYQGALAGIIFGIGALLAALLPKYKWFASAILLVLITPIALAPFWFSADKLGISDWDYYFSMHTNLWQTITQFHQFPLWNPFTCGGTSALGDPEFPVLSPLFLLELAFGTPAGLKLSIYFATAIGALGMLFLAKKMNMSPLAGLTAGMGLAFGSVNLLEIVEGHQNILAFMYIPWIFLTWYIAYQSELKKKYLYTVITAILLTLVFFQGGLYLLMYMTAAFIILPFLVSNPKKAIFITLTAGILAMGLASVKLIPVIYWVHEFQDKAYASSAYTLSSMDKILLGRYLHGVENVIPNQGSGWHEYGAYIGPVMLVLALLGFITHRKNRFAQALLITGAIALFGSSFGPYLKPFFDHVPFIPRSNIARIILFTIIPLCMLSGMGIDWLQKKSRILKYIAIILITLAAVDLMSLAYPLASQAFVLPQEPITLGQAQFPIQYDPFNYKTRYEGVDYTRAYEATLKGYGTLSYCSVLGPDPAVSIITDEGNSYVSFPSNHDASFTINSWAPNKVIITVTSPIASSAIINANYADGWMVSGNPAKNIANKVGTQIPAGTTQLTFQYVPKGMLPGIAVTVLATIITLLVLLLSAVRREK
ncbi:MAG: hypothetical protein K8Q97_00305 [Candidatus Andersenbacteria bacterium]|nr:hypothetical protein [Candidatus Andersenbacteria bacterium]